MFRSIFLASGMLACVLASIVLQAAPSAAAIWTNTGTGNWDVGSNWDGGTVPAAEDATINNGGTATVDSSNPAVNLFNLNNSSQVALHTGGLLEAADVVMNSGSIFSLDGGTFSIAGDNLDLGTGSADLAQLIQTGGIVELTGGGRRDLVIGYDGNGTYDISGGSLSGDLGIVGERPGGQGRLNIHGTAQVDLNGVIVGLGGGNGQLDISAGTLNVNNFNFDVGFTGGGVGVVNQSGGSVAMTSGSRDLVVGNNGNGTYNQSGGTFAADWGILGENAGGEARFNLSGGDADFNLLTVGFRTANGHLQVSGGALGVVGNVEVGREEGTGLFEVIGGDATIDVGGNFSMNDLSTLRFDVLSGDISTIEVAGAATLDGFLELAAAPHPAQGTMFDLLTAQSGITDNGIQLVSDRWLYAITGTPGGPQTLQVTAIPEPSTLALAALGALGLLCGWRRRHRAKAT